MTILVTGGAGFIGSHTVNAVQRLGRRVGVLGNLVYGPATSRSSCCRCQWWWGSPASSSDSP